jgi:hypothetical protein
MRSFGSELHYAAQNPIDIGVTHAKMEREPHERVGRILADRALTGLAAKVTSDLGQVERLIVKNGVDTILLEQLNEAASVST